MSKKNLLQEGTIRRFMKLAGTEAVASDFLNETHGHPGEDVMQEQEEEMDMEMDMDMEEEGPEGEEDLDLDVDMEADEDVEGAEDMAQEIGLDLFTAIADVLEKYGVETDVEETEEEELEVGEFEEPAMEEEDFDVEEEEEEEEEELEEGLNGIDYVDTDALMETVYHRVAQRLITEKKYEDLAATLAPRIAKRLNK
tara:strand:- start:15 stop:605 length:591 start_codon:yes stop_codon:yes gene_type:complete